MAGEILEPVAAPLRAKFAAAARKLQHETKELNETSKDIVMQVIGLLELLPFKSIVSQVANENLVEVGISKSIEPQSSPNELFFDTMLESMIRMIRKSLTPDWGLDRVDTEYIFEQQAEMLVISARAYTFITLTDFYSSIIPEIQNEQ